MSIPRKPRRTPRPLRPAPLPAALAAIGFCSLIFGTALHAQQLPTGGSVVSGSATIHNTSASQQLITQGSDKAIINWQGFSIGQGSSVQFAQPGAGSVVLNRVIGNDPSSIFGSLSANGQVFLVNPQGIYFSPGASLDVGGLVASTLNIRNEDFLAGRYIFNRDPGSPANTSVINDGLIRARDGGYVVLAGDYAANRGVVEARLGTVALASGAQVTLDMQGDSLINLAVNEKTVAKLAGVANSGELAAEGGRVMMTAAVARDLAGTVVNNTGTVRATGTVEKDGAIYLVGEGGDVSAGGSLNVSGARGGSVKIQSSGTTLVSGSVDAIGSAGKGGSVQVLGERAGLVDNAAIDASGTAGGGTVLVGGDYQGKNPDVQNAQRTYVGADTTIRADATQNGDGGKVIVWADDVTRFAGHISAHGGAQGGDGGFAEVSGKESLVYQGSADLRAPQGTTGTLLLDPKNISITAAGADPVVGNSLFADNAAGTSDLSAANVVTALDGANLVLQANNDITVETDVNVAAGPVGTAGQNLTLQAGRHIILASTANTAAPSTSTGAVAVTMNGGAFSATTNVDAVTFPTFQQANRDAGAAEFFMATGSSIANAGSVTIAAGSNANPVSLNDNSGAFNIGAVSTTGGAINISALNNLNINGALNSSGGAINASSDGDLGVTATGSITAGIGTVTLATTENLNVDASINLAGNISAAKVVLDSADAIGQTTGGISATQLRVMAASGAADETVNLGSASNNVGTLSAAKSTTAAGTGGIFSFNFNNGANALAIGTVDAVSGITAVAGTELTAGVTLTAGDLNINQPIVATGVNSSSVTLQPNAGTTVNIGTNTDFGLTQADLDQVTANALRIGTTAGAGSLQITGGAAITNSAGWTSLLLRAGTGGITQTAGSTLGAAATPIANLGVESTGAVTLTEAGNNATGFAANLTGGGALQFTDVNALTVAEAGLDAGNNPIAGVTVSGITTNNTNATLNTGDAITINNNVNVGSGVLTLNATQNGAIQGPGSAITTTGAGGVRLLGNLANTNNFNLNQNNDVSNLAANTNGSVTFRNAGAGTLTVGTVGGTSGISTAGSAVTLIADEMAFSQNINAGTGSVTLTSNTAARAINLGTDPAGLNFTDATLERVVTSGQLVIGDNAHTGAITVSGETVNPSQATGGIVLRNIDSNITINSVLSAGTSSVTLVADGGDPTTAVSGTIAQGAGGGIVANTLTTSSKGGTTLTGSGNDVDNFSAFESGGSDITFNNTGNLAVNGIGLGADDNVRHVTIDTTGTLTANGLITTQAANSNVTLSSGGAMNLTQDVNPGSTGTLTLRSSGSATLTGKVVANANSGGGSVANLLLERRNGTGAGAFTLNNAANDVVNIAANISGALSYVDANALEVDTVGAVNGINTNGGAVTLVAPGNVVLNQSVIASGAIVDITAAGVSSAGAAGITANGLVLRDNDTGGASPMGTYTLNGVNDVANLAALVKGNLTYNDANAFNVSAVNGVNGITTTGGNVTLSGSSMGISSNITASGAAIALTTTGGGINQTGGAITGNTLQVNSAGAATLGQGGNDVATFAAAANGAVTYTDANTVTVGSVGGTNGITSNNNNISVTGTRLLVNQHVNAGTGDVTLTTLETAAGNDDIVLNALPDVLTGTTVRLVSADAINHIAGNINATNLFAQAESGNNVTATVTGEQWIDVAGTASFNQNVAANRVVIWSSTGSTTTNQTGGAITANELVFLGRNGNPVFNFNQANNVSTLAASNDYLGFLWLPASTTISFTNAAALNVGLINTNSFTGTVQGITSNNANVTLNTAGALTLNERINAGSGTVNLTAAAGGITQSAFAPVTADFLNISSPGGAVNLGLANNNLLALNNVSVTGSSFSFKEVNNVELRGAVNVSNAGPVNVNVTAAGNLNMTGTGSITATSTGNVAPATVTLNGTNQVDLSGPVTATGGGAGSGVNAGVTISSLNGPISMNAGSSITVTDNGPATAAGAAPHSAEVVMTSGLRNAWHSGCVFDDNCISIARNITATSNQGRAVINIFGQGDAGDGVRVLGQLTATGQTRPLIRLDALTKDSDGNELTSTGNVTVSAPVTVNSTSSTAVNTLADSVIGGVSISGRNITIGGKIESRHSDGVSRAQDGISVESVRQNININADIVTSSNGGIGITTGSNGTIAGAGVIEAQNVNLVAPKSQGNFNVRTRIQPPAGFAGSGNLNVLGGDVMIIDNLSSTPLISALGFIDRSQDPANPDLPIGDLTLKTAGSLQIAALDAYNQQRHERNGFFGPLVPVKIELVSDNFIVFPGTISTPGYAEITLRPYTNTTEIFVRRNADPTLPGVVYTAAPITGLLQQFHPDAKLIIGGPNHKGDVTVGGDGQFTLGNMHLVFETGQNGRVVKNFFSSDGNIYHPEPAIAFGAIGYPGPNVSDGIGNLTSDKVQLIEAGTFQPNPGVTINGGCPAPCPGGSPGQGAITVTGGSTDPGGGGGSTSGGGGGGGGGGTSTGGTDLGGPGPDGTGSAAGTGGTGGGGSTTPADTTGSGGGTGGDTSSGSGGGVVADGGGSLSGPGDGSVTTTTSTDTTPTEDGGGIIAGDGTGGPGDGTTPGGDPSDPFGGGGGGGGTLAGDPGGTTGDGTGTGADGGGSIADGSGPGDGSTGLAGGGSGDGSSGSSGSGLGGDGTGTGGTSGSGTGGDGSDTFGGGGSGGGLAGDTSGAGGDGVADGSGGGGAGGDGGTGGSSLADGSGSGGAGGDGGSAGGGTGDGTTAGAGGDGSLSGGASGGGLAGDGSGSGGSGVAGGDGAGGDGFAGGATGGGSLADGSGSGAGGDGSSSGDGAVAGAGGDGALSGGASGGGLAGDGGSVDAGSGFAGADGTSGGGGSGIAGGGDDLAGGATGGGSLADGSSGGGFSGDGSSGGTGFADSDGTSGSGGSGIAGGGDGLAGGATGGGSFADGSGSGSGGAGSSSGSGGFAGADGSSGGSGGGIADGGDGLAGGAAGGGIADGSSSGGFSGDGSGSAGAGFAGADGTSGGSGGGIAGGGDGLAGSASGGGLAGGSGGDGTGSAGGSAGDGSIAGGSDGFSGSDTATSSGPGAGAGGDNLAGSGSGLSGELRGGASGGRISADAGEADSRDPDAGRQDADTIARSGTDTSGSFRGGASGGRASGDAGDESGRAGERSDDGKSEERDRYFEDERDAQRIRLVGGNRLISVQGTGVNLQHGDSGGTSAAPGAGNPR